MQHVEVELNYKKYKIFSDGRIENFAGHEMKPQVDRAGYCSFSVNGKRFLWHRVVAYAFLGTPLHGRRIQVHHKDEDKTNNSVDNLLPLTVEEHQHLHKQKHPTTKRCVVCGNIFTPSPTKRARAKTCSRECWLVRTREQAKKRERPVVRINPETNEAKIFSSLTDGAYSVGKGKEGISNILVCLNGRGRTAYGFVWKEA